MPDHSLTQRVRAALKTVAAPQDGRDLVAAGRLRDLSVSPAGVAKATIDTDRMAQDDAEALVAQTDQAIAKIEGVARAVIVASHRQKAPPDGASGGASGGGKGGGHADPFGLKRGPGAEQAKASRLDAVKRVVAVASGKGGVGKSTVAVNLACALAAEGARVGLLDADIYGPSLPTMLGISDAKPVVRDGRIQPIVAHGLSAMSIGFLVDAEKALAWRGPMVLGAVRQLINDVEWGALDWLIIDTPPGTGDAHLTLAKDARLDGVVIVSTPQELALADVRRGVQLFRKVRAPILGIVENMAFLDVGDGEKRRLFGDGGARRAAADLDVPFLGEIPFVPALREAADAGTPLEGGSKRAPQVFKDLSDAVSRALVSKR